MKILRQKRIAAFKKLSRKQQCKLLRMKYRFLIKRIYYSHQLVSKVERKYGSKFKKLLILKKIIKKYKKNIKNQHMFYQPKLQQQQQQQQQLHNQYQLKLDK